MSLGSLIQGAIGNPFGSQVSGAAFGVINDVLGGMRSKDGIARPARYEVVILPPTGGQNNPDRAGLSRGVREASLKCENIAFPGRNIDTTPDTNIYGPTREIATGFSFAELSARFQCSSDMKEKLFFESWQKQSFNSQTWSMGYYNDYVGSMDIYLLDTNDRRRYGVQLVECFPTDVGQQALDYTPAGDIMTLSVTWSYRYWKNLTDEADLPKPLQDRLVEILSNTVERKLTAQIPKVLSRL